jgi:hypothetical protein
VDKVEQTFTRFLNNEVQLDYPDFDAMWGRIEPNLPGTDTTLKVVETVTPKWRWMQHRKVAVISSLAVILVASPVFATVSYKLDGLLNNPSGIQSALQEGLGQSIVQSVTHDGVKLTINTAIVDDNRTVLIYSIGSKNERADYLNFSKMELKDSHNHIVEGRQSQIWDKASQTWNGYFEADWTPDSLEADVQFTAKSFHSFSSIEHDLVFNPFSDKSKIFNIKQDGIGELKVQPFVQGDEMMLTAAVNYYQPEAKEWTTPFIGVYKDNVLIKGVGTSVFGTPGEQGEFISKQFFKLSDLKQESLQYKLLYTREVQRIDKEWSYNLHLDKTKMLSGTVKRTMSIPLEGSGGRLVVEQMSITPTQIRIKTSHAKYARFPYVNYALNVNGRVIKGWEYREKYNPEETTFRFEIPSGMHVTASMPITFIAKYESVEHKDAKEPIQLEGISEQEKTMTTQVGGYSVKWTYFKRDGDLYVQSECTDPSFGGINQTYIGKGMDGKVGKPVTSNFSGDGNNKAIDLYKNYTGNDAEIYIFWYYTENPDKEVRVELKG